MHEPRFSHGFGVQSELAKFRKNWKFLKISEFFLNKIVGLKVGKVFFRYFGTFTYRRALK